MRKLFLHAKTFARLEDALKSYSDQLSPLIIDDEGDLKHPWGESEASGAIAFGTPDAYFSPAVMTFFQTLLSLDPLDWFQSSAAGIEHPILQAVGQKAKLYTGSHEQSEAIAEWVLWAGFDFFQNGAARRKHQTDKVWKRLSAREISDTRWLIIGFGAIGEATARRLRALGAHVTGVRRSGGTSPAADRMITPVQMFEDLPHADAVLLCAPLTPETENTADERFFAAMKPRSLLVNVGRGGLVDETALLAALERGQPAHASLDVVREEPLPADSPIWAHPGITLTAHISASTAQTVARVDQLFLNNLAKFLSGDRLQNVVEPEAFS